MTTGLREQVFKLQVLGAGYSRIQPLLLVSAVYSCCNSHQIPTHNPHVLSSLPSLLYVPFYLTNRAGFTTDMLTQICSLVDSGMSFHSVEGVISSQYRQHYWRLRCRFTEACTRLGVSSLSFPEFSQGTFPYPHEILLREVFMAYSSLFHHTFHTDMAVRTPSWISCDHTFKSAANIGFVRKSDGKWIKLFKCIFCVMGIDGSVIHWRFTRGESFEEVRDLLLLITTFIYIDNTLHYQQTTTKLLGIHTKRKTKITN